MTFLDSIKQLTPCGSCNGSQLFSESFVPGGRPFPYPPREVRRESPWWGSKLTHSRILSDNSYGMNTILVSSFSHPTPCLPRFPCISPWEPVTSHGLEHSFPCPPGSIYQIRASTPRARPGVRVGSYVSPGRKVVVEFCHLS